MLDNHYTVDEISTTRISFNRYQNSREDRAPYLARVLGPISDKPMKDFATLLPISLTQPITAHLLQAEGLLKYLVGIVSKSFI